MLGPILVPRVLSSPFQKPQIYPCAGMVGATLQKASRRFSFGVPFLPKGVLFLRRSKESIFETRSRTPKFCKGKSEGTLLPVDLE